jgi:hypothetical protein
MSLEVLVKVLHIKKQLQTEKIRIREERSESLDNDHEDILLLQIINQTLSNIVFILLSFNGELAFHSIISTEANIFSKCDALHRFQRFI